MNKYTFEEIYEFLEKCEHDDCNYDSGCDDHEGNLTDEQTWARDTFLYKIDEMNYEISFVEYFIDKRNNFVEISAYGDEVFNRFFQARREKNGKVTYVSNCANLRAIDNYRLMKNLSANLKAKTPGTKREKV